MSGCAALQAGVDRTFSNLLRTCSNDSSGIRAASAYIKVLAIATSAKVGVSAAMCESAERTSSKTLTTLCKGAMASSRTAEFGASPVRCGLNRFSH